MAFYVDSHCHLNFNSFENDLPAVLERARSVDVKVILIPATDLATCHSAIKLCEESGPGLFAAVGMHPNDTSGWDSGTIAELRQLARSTVVKAVGEIGLDYYRDKTEPARQKAIFSSQLELAAELNLPVIVHNRSAADDLWPILREWAGGFRGNSPGGKSFFGVLHSFDGSLDLAMEAFESGFLLGISGPVTYPNAKERRETIRQIPLDAMLLETDAPFLTPQPHRGKRNEPAYIPIIAEEVAKIKQISPADVQLTTTSNAMQLFSLGNSF